MQTEPHTLPASFTPKKREELFDEIVLLYKLADEVLAAVLQDGIVNRAVQAEIATPFVKQVTHSADVLSALFTDAACKNHTITPEMQITLEEAFRNIFEALKALAEGMQEKLMSEERNV